MTMTSESAKIQGPTKSMGGLVLQDLWEGKICNCGLSAQWECAEICERMSGAKMWGCCVLNPSLTIFVLASGPLQHHSHAHTATANMRYRVCPTNAHAVRGAPHTDDTHATTNAPKRGNWRSDTRDERGAQDSACYHALPPRNRMQGTCQW